MSDEAPLPLTTAQTWRERLRVFIPPILLSLIVLAVAYYFVQPAPPSHIVLATGSKSGAYFYFGGRYKTMLAREGISVTVRATAGSVENIHLLEAREADVAFVQGGVGLAAHHQPTAQKPDHSGRIMRTVLQPLYKAKVVQYPVRTTRGVERGIRNELGARAGEQGLQPDSG